MKPNPEENLGVYPADDCVMESFFHENLALGQLMREDSFGWLQDPDSETNPFSLPSDFDLTSVLDSERDSTEWTKGWPTKPEPTHAWHQLSVNLNTPQRRPSCHTSLTPVLAALEFPKELSLPDDIEYSCRRPDGEFSQYEYQKHNNLFPPSLLYSEIYRGCEQPDDDLGQAAVTGDIITIGMYTRAERAAKIQRFRQKRGRRNFTKRVLYGCRKRFADSRPRVGGRFVINENRVIKPKTFLKRGRPRKVPLPMIHFLAALSH